MGIFSRKRQPTGLARHASTVAFTTARALSSHLRAWFHHRYAPRYRSAGLVFGFDLFLLGVAAGLLILTAFLFVPILRPANAGIALDFHTPNVIRGSDAMPVELRLRATDGKSHEDVVLRLKLPDWVEVLSADPSIVKNSIRIGVLRPHDEKIAHLVFRIRAPKGTTVSFGFEISQPGFLGIPSIVSGQEKRTVTESALTIKRAVDDAHAIVPHASIPLVIENSGSIVIKLALVRMNEKKNAPQARFGSADTFAITDLQPKEKRVVFTEVGGDLRTPVVFSWELLDGAQVVQEKTESFTTRASPSHFSISGTVRSRRGIPEIVVPYEGGGAADPPRFFVAHPQLSSGSFEVFLARGAGPLVIPLDLTRQTSSTEWSVIPIDRSEGKGSPLVYGRRVIGHITSTFPFTAEARYYSALGDQLGIGPLPPKVGEVTSYWIVWTVGPVESELRSLTFSTTMLSHVRATGKFASQSGGTFSTDGKSVAWSVPFISATGEPVTFAFEVALTPTRALLGRTAQLIGESAATAEDARSGEMLEAIAGSDTTELSHDAKGEGQGFLT